MVNVLGLVLIVYSLRKFKPVISMYVNGHFPKAELAMSQKAEGIIQYEIFDQALAR